MAKENSELLALLNQYSKDDPNLWNILKKIIDKVAGFSDLSFDGIALPANSRAEKGKLLFDRFHKKFQHSENGRNFVDVQPHERARVYITPGPTAIPTGAITALTFNTVRYDCLDDVDLIWSATAPTRLTARYAGNYSIGACIRWAPDAVGQRLLAIRINGGARIVQSLLPNNGAAFNLDQNVSADWEMNPTDYVECVVFQDTGAPLNVLTTTSWSPEFWIKRNN